MSEIERNFSWLHLSDLHCGIDTQNWLWPRLKSEFYDDMARIVDRAGPWQAVIFSGDLTQKAAPDEFDRFTGYLSELWEAMDKHSILPSLFTVPGNHDLVRPLDILPETAAMHTWWENDLIRRDFWSDSKSTYRNFIERSFENYREWTKKCYDAGIPIKLDICGDIAGDFSSVLSVNGMSVGIVGINSSWLQISDKVDSGRLCVDTRQILSVTQGDPAAWCEKNDINIIVSHHPLEWLHSESADYWRNDISPSGRFDAHLFGHMHEPLVTSTSVGGSYQRNSFQAPSIFGLEKAAGGKVVRIHGYTHTSLIIGERDRKAVSWPRRLRKLSSGEQRLGADNSFDLIDDTHFEFSYSFPIARSQDGRSKAMDSIAGSAVNVVEHLGGQTPLAASDEALEKLRTPLALCAEHRAVRRIEQQMAKDALETDRAFWLCAEWGMAPEKFVAQALDALGRNLDSVFSIDFEDFSDRESFLSSCPGRIGLSFERICERLSKLDSPTIFIKNCPISDEDKSIQSDIEKIVRVAIDYCQEFFIILESVAKPISSRISSIALRALDEADTAIYVKNHHRGNRNLERREAVEIIFRHSDGVPDRVDSALRELEVVSLEQLRKSDPDLAIATPVAVVIPLALEKTLQDLSESTDEQKRRCFSLLKVLSVLPHGERLERIRRFNGAKAFYNDDAMALIDKSLASSSAPIQITSDFDTSSARTLTVQRTVRERVRHMIGKSEMKSLNLKCLDLYFGNKWGSAQIKTGSAFKFDDPLRSPSEISNASIVIVRMIRDSVEKREEYKITSGINLASAYIAALLRGDHFRSAASVCRDVLDVIPESYERQISILKYQYGKSVRMSGNYKKALEILESVVESMISKEIRKDYLLSLALAYQSCGKDEKAVATCRRIIAGWRTSHAALQAKGIMLQLTASGAGRASQLRAHAGTCFAKKANVAGCNILIELAEREEVDEREREEILKQALSVSERERDFYNTTRIIVKMSECDSGEFSSDIEKFIMRCYHYLYNERLISLLNRCTKSLWEKFEEDSEIGNLLTLFHYSSLVWRLSEDESREKAYTLRLAQKMTFADNQEFRGMDREAAYFITRVRSLAPSVPISLPR